MSRFYLTSSASSDLTEIRAYLDPIAERHAGSIRRGLRALLHDIGAHPLRGTTHSDATRLLGEEVRVRTLPPYRVFYRDLRGTPEVLGILHGAQNIDEILRKRLQ